MAGRESIHKKLTRVRPPRVQISYDVEIGGAMQLRELPFVLGVLGDFTGQPVEALEELKKRRFIDVVPEKFDEVLAGMKPHLAFSIPNKLDPKGGDMRVDLTFNSLMEFEPDQVAQKIPETKKLLELRTKLNDLRGTLQTNESLDDALMKTVSNTESLNKVRGEIEKEKAAKEAGTGDKK